MHRRVWRFLVIAAAVAMASLAAAADDPPRLQEEVWALPLPAPTIAYVVRPVGDGPFPLAIMNHGVSLDPVHRGFFPLVEFRDAAMWFARRGYMVVAPTGPGYGAAAIDVPEAGLFTAFFSKIGKCSNPNFRDAGLAAAQLNLWIIEYMSTLKRIVPDNVIVIGQSAGGWGSIALSSVNPPGVKAIIAFAAGRGGRVDGKPNNNCGPDKLVETTAAFGRTSRVPMLWLYIENDTFFGPELSKRMPNITFSRHTAAMVISSSVRRMPFRSGRRSSVPSSTSTSEGRCDTHYYLPFCLVSPSPCRQRTW